MLPILDELEQYFKYISTLKYEEIPDYNKLRKMFQDGLRKRKYTDDGQTVKFKPGDCASSSNDEAFECFSNDKVSYTAENETRKHTLPLENY